MVLGHRIEGKCPKKILGFFLINILALTLNFLKIVSNSRAYSDYINYFDLKKKQKF